jgi:hypothetical protein
MALAWLGIVAAMTSNGFSGNQRYLVMPVTLAVVVACVGIGWAARELRGLRGPALLAVAAAVALVVSEPYWDEVRPTLDSLDYQARLLDDFRRSVADAGGTDRLTACGPVATGAFLVPTSPGTSVFTRTASSWSLSGRA